MPVGPDTPSSWSGPQPGMGTMANSSATPGVTKPQGSDAGVVQRGETAVKVPGVTMCRSPVTAV